MDIKKRYELQQKKNEELQRQVDDLERQVDKLRMENERFKADADYQKKLIAELEELRVRWRENLDGADKVRKEYEILIAQLRVLRGKMRVE